LDVNGAISRYRARLVAQGFSQIPGIHFLDNYAPVAKLATIRTIFAFANCHNYEIHQVDIKSAYLNGEFKYGSLISPGMTPNGTGDPISSQPLTSSSKVSHQLQSLSHPTQLSH
jgi:hypothetical protein